MIVLLLTPSLTQISETGVWNTHAVCTIRFNWFAVKKTVKTVKSVLKNACILFYYALCNRVGCD